MVAPSPIPSGVPKSSRWKLPLIVIGVMVGLLIVFGIQIAFWVFSASEFEPSTSQKESVITIDYASEFFLIDRDAGVEEWDFERFIDGSIQIYYLYVDESTSLDCTISVERNRGDALSSYIAEWQTLKLRNKFSEVKIEIEAKDEVFAWGDDSKFGFQLADDTRNGFAFIARKDNKIYFVDAWGLLLEDPEEISEFLTPKLKIFAAESYLE
ncbi:hypothetical protein N9108_08000 [Akkermansiaceae bacterium]|nr:hypothetical protein [Akkermansiaceae bacterium]MDB4503876.1 hypothetical protein [Akkermansiaceae bacterium]